MGLGGIGALRLSSLLSLRVVSSLLLSKVGAGVICYLMSAVLYIIALSREDVSKVYPLFSLTYIGVVAGAFFILGERFGPGRLAGVALVIAGCFIIMRY